MFCSKISAITIYETWLALPDDTWVIGRSLLIKKLNRYAKPVHIRHMKLNDILENKPQAFRSAETGLRYLGTYLSRTMHYDEYKVREIHFRNWLSCLISAIGVAYLYFQMPLKNSVTDLPFLRSRSEAKTKVNTPNFTSTTASTLLQAKPPALFTVFRYTLAVVVNWRHQQGRFCWVTSHCTLLLQYSLRRRHTTITVFITQQTNLVESEKKENEKLAACAIGHIY